MMNRIKDMDGRDKPGHDEGEASNIIEGWYKTICDVLART